MNAAYLTYRNSYSEEVFEQIRDVNGLFLNPLESTTFVPNQYLQPLIDYYHLENMTFDQLEDSVLLLVKIKNNAHLPVSVHFYKMVQVLFETSLFHC